MDRMETMLRAFERLPYHAELVELEGQVPANFAASKFSSEDIKKNLEFHDRYLKGMGTVDYLALLAEFSVAKTYNIYVNEQHAHRDLTPKELAIKVRADLLCDRKVDSDSERILSRLHWVLNEKTYNLIPCTHKIFTRYTKLFVLDIAFREKQGRNFLKFFRAFNPTWRFERAEQFIAVS